MYKLYNILDLHFVYILLRHIKNEVLVEYFDI